MVAMVAAAGYQPRQKQQQWRSSASETHSNSTLMIAINASHLPALL